MDEYNHGMEHADLCRRVEEACHRLDAHLLEHEGLAVPHHSHSAGADISEALHDLAGGAEEPGEGTEEPEASEEPEGEPEAVTEPEEGEEHPPTVDALISPADEGREEGEPKRAHPLFTRVFGG